MSIIFSIYPSWNLYCLDGFNSHFQITYLLKNNWRCVILQLSPLQVVGFLIFPSTSKLVTVQIPKKEYLIGQGKHYDPCWRRFLNTTQFYRSYHLVGYLSLGHGPAVNLLLHVVLGVDYEVQNRAMPAALLN